MGRQKENEKNTLSSIQVTIQQSSNYLDCDNPYIMFSQN